MTLQDGSKELNYLSGTIMDYAYYRAKRIIKMKYRETKVVNYRQEDNDSNTLSTCTFLDCDEYRTDYDG